MEVPASVRHFPTQSRNRQALPYHAIGAWADLPAGWNLGEVSAVDVDRSDTYVEVFSDGVDPVIELDRRQVPDRQVRALASRDELCQEVAADGHSGLSISRPTRL